MKNTVLKSELKSLLSKPASYYENKIIEANKKFKFDKPVILFGAAKMGTRFFDLLKENNVTLLSFCDNDSTKVGKNINDRLIISPKTLVKKYPKTTQIIITSLYDEEIKNQLKALGFKNIWSYSYFVTLFSEKFSSLSLTTNIKQIFSNKKFVTMAFNLLEDDTSKKVFLNILKYRLTLNKKFLKKIVEKEKNVYFDSDIFPLSNNEVLLDGGAYNGDTLELFFKATNNKFSKIYCFEPDVLSFNELKKFVAKNSKKTLIKCFKYGLGAAKSTVYFNNIGALDSAISDTGKIKISMVPIDQYLDEKFSLIKLDIEGYEKEALLGAKKVIKRDKPKLAICSYHHQNDLWEIPLLIKKINHKYKLYLRQYDSFLFDTICYGI
ncbi:MAG: FkbM family methyltransferase [Patescibacteria group bacterium]